MTLDARTQTDYGTLRSYIRAGWNQSTPGLVGAGTTPCNNGAANNCLAYWDRAFIQFAGFTVGRGQSFFDLFTYGGAYTYLNVRTAGDTGAAGVDLWAYTVQFGNGVSYTLSLEDPAGHSKFGTCDGSNACWGINGGIVSDNGLVLQGGNNNGFRVPDIVTNLRIDQAWGYLGLSTVIHDVSGAYYGRPTTSTTAIRRTSTAGRSRSAACSIWPAATSSVPTSSGPRVRPVTRRTPAPGRSTTPAAALAWAGPRTVSSTPTTSLRQHRHRADPGLEHQRGLPAHLGPGRDLGRQVAHDGVWRLRQHLVHRQGQEHHQLASSWLQAAPRPAVFRSLGAVWPPLNIAIGQHNSCSPDYSFYQVGSRTQFNPAPLMDIGLDVVYTRLNTAYKGASRQHLSGERSTAGGQRDRRPERALGDRPLAAQLLPLIA